MAHNCSDLSIKWIFGKRVQHVSQPNIHFIDIWQTTTALILTILSPNQTQMALMFFFFSTKVGSFVVFVLRHKNLLGGGKQDLLEIARVIALNMAIGLLSRGIDNWGHLGGLLGGAAISWFLGPAWKYKFLLDRGSVLVDGAPIFHLIKRKRLR